MDVIEQDRDDILTINFFFSNDFSICQSLSLSVQVPRIARQLKCACTFYAIVQNDGNASQKKKLKKYIHRRVTIIIIGRKTTRTNNERKNIEFITIIIIIIKKKTIL